MLLIVNLLQFANTYHWFGLRDRVLKRGRPVDVLASFFFFFPFFVTWHDMSNHSPCVYRKCVPAEYIFCLLL